MHLISEELARLRLCELLSEARKERLAAEAGRASLSARLRRSMRSRG